MNSRVALYLLIGAEPKLGSLSAVGMDLELGRKGAPLLLIELGREGHASEAQERHPGGTTPRESMTGDGDERTNAPEHRRRRVGRPHRNPRWVKPMQATTEGWDRRIHAVEEHIEREEQRPRR